MKPHSIETAKEFLRLCSFGLTKGLGEPKEGKMCVEAAIALAHDLPHQDKNPSCVDESVARHKILLNDCDWSSNAARAEGMKAIGLAQLGSNSLREGEFNARIRLNSAKIVIPFLIQKHYEKEKDEELIKWKIKFESLTKINVNLLKRFFFWIKNSNHCNNYYNYYHNYTYYYHTYYNYTYNYYYKLGDEFLLVIASCILQTLKDLSVEGCKYLILLENTN